VQAAIAEVSLVQAEFREKRVLAGFSRPLESRGTLVFSRRFGVYRRQTSPLPLETVISSRGIFQRGSEAWGAVDAARNPAARGLLGVFLSAFSGDPGVWGEQFDVEFTGTLEAWRVRLLPRRGRSLARRVKAITLEGSRALLFHLTMEELGGAITETFFSGHKIRGDLSEEEDLSRFPEALHPFLRP
jgi:hypothetical protein